MVESMKRIECEDSTCDFAVQSPDEQEVVQEIMEHEKNAHNKNVSEKEVRAQIKTVENSEQNAKKGHLESQQGRTPGLQPNQPTTQ